MFNNYSKDCEGFTSIPKGKLHPKFMILDIKSHGTKNPHHHVRDFLNATTLKGIDKNIFHVIFCWTLNKDVMW